MLGEKGNARNRVIGTVSNPRPSLKIVIGTGKILNIEFQLLSLTTTPNPPPSIPTFHLPVEHDVGEPDEGRGERQDKEYCILAERRGAK